MHAVGGEARYVDPTGKAARPGNWNLARPCGDSSSPLFYDDRPMVIRPGRSFLVVWTLGATSERYVWHCSAEVGTRRRAGPFRTAEYVYAWAWDVATRRRAHAYPVSDFIFFDAPISEFVG